MEKCIPARCITYSKNESRLKKIQKCLPKIGDISQLSANIDKSKQSKRQQNSQQLL